MRTFYIFKINNFLNPMYERKTINIYKILDKINNLDKKEYLLAKKLYSKIIIPFNKNKIDNFLLMNHMNDLYYTKNKNMHILKSSMEDSKLYIYNTYIKIITTKNISTFFKDIYNFDKDLFVVDFINKDFFYIGDLKAKLLAS